MSFFSLEESFYGAYSGWDWQSTKKNQALVSHNPSTEQELSKIWTCDTQDIEHIIHKAQAAFVQWRNVPAPTRGQVIKDLGDLLRQHLDDLSDLIVLEMGKTKREALGEVQEMIDMADYVLGLSRMLYGKTMHSERPFHRLYEQWHPYGVVGVWTSFNFPMAVWSWNAFIALVCGNVVIWKPSSKTPLCAIALHQLCMQVLMKRKLPAILSLVIPSSHELSKSLIQDKRLPLISFTGSTAIGREVGQWVAARFGRCILELGGNNAVIIDESANLEMALRAIVFGALGTSGQRCTSTRRVFIQKKYYSHFKQQLIKVYQRVKVGDPMQVENLMGPLIDQAAVYQYEDTLKQIQSAGGEILYGGSRIKQLGYFVSPVLVQGLSHDHPILQRETFAPILYLLPFERLEDAIYQQNAVPQGLSSALFSQNHQNIEYFLSVMGSDCGIANINVGTSGAEITGAFGGEKETGGGREAGSDAWKAYMRRQTNTINWGAELPLAQGIQFDA